MREPLPRLGFWGGLPRPIWALAPMEDVTDTVLRRLVRRWSRGVGPTVAFTEFTRVDAPLRALAGYPPGRLWYSEEERPIVAQLWGTRPEEFFRSATAIESLGFDGIDLNFGCPVKKIRAAGACSALIATPPLAAEIIAAVRDGTTLPVSAKTRIGLDRPRTEEWCGFLLAQGLAALTVHGRTAAEMSEGWADWREVARVARLRDAIAPGTRVLGNGDVYSLTHARRLVEQTGVDGVMFGRGIFRDPLLFARACGAPAMDGAGPPRHPFADTGSGGLDRVDPDPWAEMPLRERLDYLEAHIHEWRAVWGERRNWEILKKFFRNYLRASGAAPTHRLERGAGDGMESTDGRRKSPGLSAEDGAGRSDSPPLSEEEPSSTDLLEELYAARTTTEALEAIASFRATASLPCGSAPAFSRTADSATEDRRGSPAAGRPPRG